MKRIHKITFILSACLLSIGFTSCEKMLEIKPDDVLLSEDALKTPEDLQKLLNSCYDATANQLNGQVQVFNDLMSDDIEKPFIDDLGFRTEIWNRNTNFFNSDVGGLYNRLYISVYRVNSMELYYDKIPGLSASEKQRMQAEGRFIRALSHFEIVKLWANPYGYTADNSHPGIPIRKEASQEPLQRSSVAEVYAFIISDLQFAIQNLPASNGKYADQNAAKALLALVYFQMNDYANAEPLLSEVINSGLYTLSDSLDRYNSNLTGISQEFVFSFVSLNNNDNRGGEFIGRYRSDIGSPSYGITQELYNFIKQDTTDARGNLIDVVNEGQANQYFVTKKFNNDYFGAPYITLTQLLLTRAEVLAELNQNTSQAVSDINQIIARAYPGNANKLLPSNESAANIVSTVRSERRKELFCEGDRVQYLKRLGAFGATSVAPVTNLTIRSAPWNCPGLALQFPSTEQTSVFIMNETGGCN